MKQFLKHLALAGVFAFLNLAVNYISDNVFKIPIFMDMIFIYAASFFGLYAGILCSVFYSLLDFLMISRLTDNLPYIVCMITGVVIVCIFMKNKKFSNWLTLLLIALISALLISIEGGIIYTLLFADLNLSEFQATVYLTAQLLMSNIPLLASAILARIPINLADKLVAVFLGYGIFLIIKKLEELSVRKIENRGEI